LISHIGPQNAPQKLVFTKGLGEAGIAVFFLVPAGKPGCDL
jgi:hypothetical protein